MTSTIENIISGSSSIQQRNKSITDGLLRSLGFAKSLIAEDVLLLLPSQVNKKEITKKVNSIGPKGTISAIPSAPNRPAPCPPGENINLIQDKDTGSRNLNSIEGRNRSQTNCKIPTRTYSEIRSRVKSEKPLQYSNYVSADHGNRFDRQQSIKSLVESRINTKTSSIREVIEMRSGTVKNQESESSVALDHSLRSPKSSTLMRKQPEKKVISKGNTPYIARKSAKKNELSSLFKEISIDAVDLAMNEATTPECNESNILESIIRGDRVPLLTELSKSDIQEVKMAFKTLHDQVNSHHASPTDIVRYKKLKIGIKSKTLKCDDFNFRLASFYL